MRRILAIFTPIAGFFLLSWGQTFFGAAAIVGAPACSTSDAGLLGVITGIEVLSDNLTEGHGCGTGPGQIYRYASIVTVPGDIDAGTAAGAYIAGAVTDCFANAIFQNLCSYANGVSTFDVSVYVFTKAEWDLAAPGAPGTDDAGPAVADAGDGDASVPDASPSPPAPPSPPVSGEALTAEVNAENNAALALITANNTCPAATASANRSLGQLVSDLQASAGWVTHCTATQQSNVPVIASCDPLVPLR